MNFQFAASTFFVFLFALVRSSAWLSFVPPFSSGVIPRVVRLGLAASLALAATPQLAAGVKSGALVTLSTAAFISGLVVQAAIGSLLGFMTSIIFSVVSSAGSLTDMASGLSASTTFDPISGTPNPVTANTYNLLLTTLLFATGGDLVVVKGFMTSFRAAGLNGHTTSLIGPALISEIGYFFVATVEIAAPVIGCMFLAYVALGLLTRAAPQLNVMSLGFAINIALALVVIAACLPLMPGAVSTLVDRAVRDSLGLMGLRP